MQFQWVIWIALALAAVLAWRLGSAWLKFRGQRVVQCPENMRPAGVVVDARHAAATALGKQPDLRLASCSRWPEHSACGQECLRQIEAAPADCLVRNILVHWYEGKQCASCGQPFGEIQWANAKPALLVSDKVAVEWDQVPAEQLQATLDSAKPICFACHMASRLVREHPELALDRARPRI